MVQASAYSASDGAAYEVFLGRWTRALGQRMVEFARFPEGPLLDVGCGTGSLAGAMATRGPAIGVDVAVPYVVYANEHAVGPRFVAGEAGRLPFANGVFAGAAT